VDKAPFFSVVSSLFQERHPNLFFGNAGCSDGGFLNLMFYNTSTQNAHKKSLPQSRNTAAKFPNSTPKILDFTGYEI
jgi:hypothetical protein